MKIYGRHTLGRVKSRDKDSDVELWRSKQVWLQYSVQRMSGRSLKKRGSL